MFARSWMLRASIVLRYFGISEGGALAMLFAASHPRARYRADHLRVLRAACLGRGLPTWLSPGCLGCVQRFD